MLFEALAFAWILAVAKGTTRTKSRVDNDKVWKANSEQFQLDYHLYVNKVVMSEDTSKCFKIKSKGNGQWGEKKSNFIRTEKFPLVIIFEISLVRIGS